MRDGSDAVSDWPLLNALLNSASGATWVVLHHGGGVGMGFSQHAGMVIVARRHAGGGEAASSACCGTTRPPASCATPMPATRSRSTARASTGSICREFSAAEMPSLHFGTALLPEGWRQNVLVEIREGRITKVLVDARPRPEDERHGIGLPGMPNLHSHAFQRAMAGMAEHGGPGPDDFWTWREAMYRVALSVTPDDVEAIAAQLYVEMLEAGFTRVGEFHYLHHDADGSPYANIAEMANRVVAAASETGIGMTLLPVFYAARRFRRAAPSQGSGDSSATSTALRSCSRRARRRLELEGANIGVAPHSLRAVAPEELAALSRSRDRADPHPRGRADEGGRGMPRVVGKAPGRMAARQRAVDAVGA